MSDGNGFYSNAVLSENYNLARKKLVVGAFSTPRRPAHTPHPSVGNLRVADLLLIPNDSFGPLSLLLADHLGPPFKQAANLVRLWE